ncbi:N-acetylgalactosaminyltransferase 4-like [Chironomus tepperi]|uniref:N-acetylgalactosaminyltransferase 4-like n=1 Tax=Chironomus tepperi TaxID=113505 RepID=UPI00391F3787
MGYKHNTFLIFWLLTCTVIASILLINNEYLTVNFISETEEYKDWNDYEIIIKDSYRTGFGEHGKGEKLTDANDIDENNRLWSEWGFSVVVSDRISVNRSIPDFRHPKCLKMKYLKDLPKVSIIIIFVDENFHVFKRTLHSLYNRTPHELIEEVILVNDNSTKDYLYDPLKNYVEENFPEIQFNIINLNKRHGLMQARVIGAKAARSEFLFISEPHCEMTYNWLPPLLQPLVNDKKVVTVPIVDNIEYNELQYYQNDRGNKGSRGVFDWNLEYMKLKRFPMMDEDKELDPFLTPVMTGGIFMIRKSYFFEIGPYDPGLVIWGGENVEMSLKIHLCGGQLLEVPCSHIGHIFRAFTKSRKHEDGMDFEGFNRKRVVEVWFEDYKEHVYKRNRKRYSQINTGNLTAALKFKEKLKCKPFDYFLKVIAPDLTENFPMSPDPFATGRIQLFDDEYCLETKNQENEAVVLKKCSCFVKSTQNFELSWWKSIRLKGTNTCIDGDALRTNYCHGQGGMQHFKYDIDTKQIKNMVNNKCLQGEINEESIKFANCNDSIKLQQWIFSDFMNETALNDWKNSGRPMHGDDDVYWS